jgi:mRNA-degrading endonuclease RelE of RelBE toxin-antitoxin system
LPRLVLTRRAEKDLKALPGAVGEAVAGTLDQLAIDYEAIGKPLIGRLEGTWSARVGSYRGLYTVEASSRSARVVVRSIRHRATAYGSSSD